MGTWGYNPTYTWNLKHPCINGCFNWIIQNLYIGNGWLFHHFHPFKTGCFFGFQVEVVTDLFQKQIQGANEPFLFSASFFVAKTPRLDLQSDHPPWRIWLPIFVETKTGLESGKNVRVCRVNLSGGCINLHSQRWFLRRPRPSYDFDECA